MQLVAVAPNWMSISWWMNEKLLHVHIMQCYATIKKRDEHTKPEWLLKIWGVEECRHIIALTRWYFFPLPLNDIYRNPSLCLYSIRNISIKLSWVKTCLLASFYTTALSRVCLQHTLVTNILWNFGQANFFLWASSSEWKTGWIIAVGSNFSSSISPGMKKWQKSRRSCSCI